MVPFKKLNKLCEINAKVWKSLNVQRKLKSTAFLFGSRKIYKLLFMLINSYKHEIQFCEKKKKSISIYSKKKDILNKVHFNAIVCIAEYTS